MELGDDAIDPPLRRFADYWESLRPTPGVLPARRALDPIDIPDLLAGIVLIDVVPPGGPAEDAANDGWRYRFRLFGSRHVEVHQADLTGAWLDEAIPPAELPPIVASLDEAVARRAPTFSAHAITVPSRGTVAYKRVLCPLAEDGRAVDTLAGYYHFV